MKVGAIILIKMMSLAIKVIAMFTLSMGTLTLESVDFKNKFARLAARAVFGSLFFFKNS